MTALLEIKDLRVKIGAMQVVDGLNFTIAPRQTFVLLGESGSGKSMTALSIMRLLPEYANYVSGEVRLHGHDVLRLPESKMRALRGGEIGMIFQEPMSSLNPVLTVGTQLQEALILHQGLHGKALRAAALALLDAVGIADSVRRLHSYPFQISGGMKQRAMIAMSLAGNPSILIADEPTTALDVTVQAQVLELLRRIQQERGMGMLLITHDLAVAAQMADEVGVMYAGELLEVAERESFFRQPRHPYSRKLMAAMPSGLHAADQVTDAFQVLVGLAGSVPALDQIFVGCRFAERCDEVMEVCRQVVPPWHTVREGHRVRCHAVALNLSPERLQNIKPIPITVYKSHIKRVVLSINNAQVYFPLPGQGVVSLLRQNIFRTHQAGRKLIRRQVLKAVDGVSFELFQGETLALVGESGCGKTTLGKAIVQLQSLTAGTIVLNGVALGGSTRAIVKVQRAAIQMVFQDPFSSLNPRMRIRDLLEEGMLALGTERDATRRLARLEDLMEQVGLAKSALQRYPHEFSGGQRQRIAIARALAVQPQILVCDEPTSALDVSVQAQIVNVLQKLQTDMGLSMLFITHNIPLARHLAQRIAVMYLGRIVEIGESHRLAQHPAHPYTQALLRAVPTLVRSSTAGVYGEPASASNPPIGCHYHPRCERAEAICSVEYPPMRSLADGRQVACYFPDT